MPTQTLRKPIFGKIVVLLFFLFTALEVLADVQVSRALFNGRNPRIFKNSWTSFECFVENNDSKDRMVEIRIRPTEDGSGQTNFCSGEILVPARTTLFYHFPVFLENEENYTFDAKSDGIRLPKSAYNETPVKLLDFRARTALVINDDDDSPGALGQLPKFKNKIFISNIRAYETPVLGRLLAENEAVFLYKPDYASFSEEQYQALLTYVSEGGTLVFLTPESILGASRTPLAELLPVHPIAIRKTDSVSAIRAIAPEWTPAPGWETDFLISVPGERGVTNLSEGEFPLIQTMQYGLGTVKAVLFPLGETTMQGNFPAMEALYAFLLSKQDLYPNRTAFTDTLDKLTGFHIPEGSTIRGYIVVYLGGLLALLLLGIILRHSGTAWFLSVLFAAGMTVLILRKASDSFAERDSVLAEISIRMEGPVSSGETFASCFSIPEQVLSAGTGQEKALFSSIAASPKIISFHMSSLEDDLAMMDSSENRKKRPEPRQVRISSPLEIHRGIDGAQKIRGLHLAARTSKQFMIFHNAPYLSTPNNALPEPELILSDKGIELAPWKFPNGTGKAPESVWLVLPGGVREVRIAGDGTLHLSKGEGIFVDSAAKELMDSLCDGVRKPSPFLAFVYGNGNNFIRLDNPMIPQGKHISILPVRITAATRKVRIPKEFLVMTPGNSTARTFFRGNRILEKATLMTGQTQNPRISLPGFLNGIFRPKSVRIQMDCTISDNVSMEVSLKGGPSIPDGKIKGTRLPDSGYEFHGDLSSVLPVAENGIELELESRLLADPSGMSPELAMRTNQWNLRSIEAEITGTIDDAISLPAKF